MDLTDPRGLGPRIHNGLACLLIVVLGSVLMLPVNWLHHHWELPYPPGVSYVLGFIASTVLVILVLRRFPPHCHACRGKMRWRLPCTYICRECGETYQVVQSRQRV